MKEKFYLTTAIAYTSRKPHIGNTYEIVLSDAVARMKRLLGYDVFFCNGTDEHGQKIEEYANAAGVSPKEYVDKVSKEVRDIWDCMNTSYDHFIRTTDDYHEKVVQKIFKKLYEQGDIYKSEYSGKYCTPCESFWTESQLVDGCCPDCGRPVTEAKEEAYFFKMSKYQDRLMKHIEENPDFIVPESRKKEMINNFLKPGLQDLCVSRTSFKWGIPVDFDDKHVVYVWLDALTNYITALGYDPDHKSEKFEKYWPADVHIIGKDILRFHTIYWPIFLMALGEELPKQVFGHPWLLSGTDKMSKSKGNVIYADDLVSLFGVDAVRYYLLANMPYAQDGNITYENVITRYNTDLANTLGNLVNRTIAMDQKYFDGRIMEPTAAEPVDEDLKAMAIALPARVEARMNELKVAEAIDEIFSLLRRANKYIDETMPWSLAKEEGKQERLGTVLYNLLETIRFSAILLEPYLPETSARMLKQLGVENAGIASLEKFGGMPVGKMVGQAEILFNRIDRDQKLAELEAWQAAQSKPACPAIEVEPQLTDHVDFDTFCRSDLRAVKVKNCERVKKSEKLLRFTLDDGTGKDRQILSGIAKYYKPEDLVGKTLVAIVNLPPRKMMGLESCGMLISAVHTVQGEEQLNLLMIDGAIPAGAKLC